MTVPRERRRESPRLAAAGMMLVLVTLAVFATWSNVAASRAAAKVSKANSLVELYTRARLDVSQALSLEREYRVETVSSVLAAHTAASLDLDTTLKQLASQDPAHRRQIARLIAVHKAYFAGSARVFGAVAAGNTRLATRLDDTITAPLQAALESRINAVSQRQAVITDAAISNLRRTNDKLLIATPAAFAFGLLILALLLRMLRSYQRTILIRATRDALTGLPNRECFYDRGAQALLADQRRQSATSVLIIDLDRFKDLNDTLGHRYGDQLLCQIGPRLSPLLRRTDTLVRLGGDEFAILLPESGGPVAAHEVAERLIARLREPFSLDGVWFTIDASCGHASSPQDGTDIDALLQHADVAMYVAKEAHTDAIAYDAGLDVNTPTRLAILNELPNAIRDGDLILYYQPKTDIATNTVVGAEALVRWEHPTRGIIPPDEFVPAAEHSGLIKPLTNWVLDTALAQCRHWMDTAGRSGRADLTVAVNVSARNLLDENFPREVLDALDRQRVPAALLDLEVTETALMADPQRAHAILRELHDLGIKISIDDFGTGYSSLSYLKFLPVNELKIDKSFVMHMSQVPDDLTIVRSVIDLAHNLGLKTVAEGIEDRATLEQLADLGCDLAQGYHLARPMTADALDAWLVTANESSVLPTKR